MAQLQRVLYSLGRLSGLDQFAANLASELNWEPAYWITQPEIADAVAARFPDIVCHDFSDGNRGVNDPIPPEVLAPFDPAMLTEDGHLLRQGLEVVARHVLGGVLTVDQQMDFLFERLAYAIGVTKAQELQVFVLNSSPHCPIDFAFYMAFRLLRRTVRILQLTGFRGLQVVLPGPEEHPLGLDQLSNLSAESLSEASQKELNALRQASCAPEPWYVTRQKERDNKHTRRYQIADAVLGENRYPPGAVSFDRPVQREATRSHPVPVKTKFGQLFGWNAKQSSRATAAELVKPTLVDAFKRRHNPKHDRPMRRAFAYRSEGFRAEPITWRHYYTYRDWALLTKRRWFHTYERLTAGFDFEAISAQPYVYFALHYQPERTTSPEGGIFSDQLLAIRTIARAIPAGWRILVKEHPSQFLWQTEGELGRWEGYYESLQASAPVDLVPLEISSDTLIERAAAVVTLNGTVGWESCVAGVPVITLAKPWYAACGTTLMACDVESLHNAFSRIGNGWRPDDIALEAHLARLERVGRRCYLNPSHAALYEDLSENENITNLTDLFVSVSRLTGVAV